MDKNCETIRPSSKVPGLLDENNHVNINMIQEMIDRINKLGEQKEFKILNMVPFHIELISASYDMDLLIKIRVCNTLYKYRDKVNNEDIMIPVIAELDNFFDNTCFAVGDMYGKIASWARRNNYHEEMSKEQYEANDLFIKKFFNIKD